MKNRLDFIKHLHESATFKAALRAAPTDAERAQIKATAEQFVDSFAAVLAPLIERAERDPVFAEQLGRRLVGEVEVVTASDPATSGSTG
jgi:hypothetical protein